MSDDNKNNVNDFEPENLFDVSNNVVNDDVTPKYQSTNNKDNIIFEGFKENIEPESSYTSPQNISPMPSIENFQTYGTIPPNNDNEVKYVKNKNGNKTLFVLIVIILLFGVGFGTYYILKYTDLLNKPVKITVKDVKVNVNTELPVDLNSYATIENVSPSDCKVLNALYEPLSEIVDIEKEGTYTFIVVCNVNNEEYKERGVLTVVDNTELIVETRSVYKTKDEEITAREFIVDENEDYNVEFVSESELSDAIAKGSGLYDLKIRVSNGKKTTEVIGKLTIMDYKIKGYLTCYSKKQNVGVSSTHFVLEEKFAIVADNNNGFGGISEETYTYTFSDEIEYSRYLEDYKRNGEITINNTSGAAKFDDNNLTITITREREKSEVISAYGEDVMKNYGSIRNYFTNTLGYTCYYK